MPKQRIITQAIENLDSWIETLIVSTSKEDREGIIEEMRKLRTELRKSDARETRDDPTVRKARKRTK